MTTFSSSQAFRKTLEDFIHHYGREGAVAQHRAVFRALVTGNYIGLPRRQREELVGYCEALEALLKETVLLGCPQGHA